MKLWSVQSGKCLYTWEFPTAVKRVAFNDDDDMVVCITEQRMGFQGAVRVFKIERDGDGRDRKLSLSCYTSFAGGNCMNNYILLSVPY